MTSILQLQNILAASIVNAKNSCKHNRYSKECVLAWEKVEELSATLSHKKKTLENLEMNSSSFDKYCYLYPNSEECKDLETFCEHFPYADECKIYD